MQAYYAAQFERDMACTEPEWLMWLPAAVGDWPLALLPGQAVVHFVAASLTLRWQPLAPRNIGLVTLPRLAVRFEFDGLPETARQVFMQRFDLYMQRGGG